MAQYYIQIQTQESSTGVGIGWLAKSFEVTAECPIPGSVPAERTPVILTNEASFNGIVDTYNTHGYPAVTFSYDDVAETISSAGAYVHTWDKD